MLLIALMAAALASQPIKLENGPVPIEQLFARKSALGETAFAMEADAAIARLEDRTEKTDRCESPAETAAAAQLALVRRSPDPRAYARSRAAAEAALSERQALKALYLGGGELPGPYGLINRMAGRARAEPDPRLAELYRRMAEDQFAHIDSISVRMFLGPGVHTTWEHGLDDAALAYVDATVTAEWCPIKVASAAWLKADQRRHGWYRTSIYGADADRAAWLIVQHARHDLAFQKEALAMLAPLWQVGETRGENFARLYDQTARYDGRPGRFGVMGECTARGVWTPASLEDRSAVDSWRAKAGMGPFADYVATRSRGCVD